MAFEIQANKGGSEEGEETMAERISDDRQTRKEQILDMSEGEVKKNLNTLLEYADERKEVKSGKREYDEEEKKELSGKIERLQHFATDLILHHKKPEMVDTLIALLEHEEIGTRNKDKALWSLVDIGDKKAIEPIHTLMTSHNMNFLPEAVMGTRMDAAMCLAAFGDPRGVEWLKEQEKVGVKGASSALKEAEHELRSFKKES